MQYGLIGGKLGHSFSPQLHKMLWDCAYELKELTPPQAEVYLREREFSGINVTIPYKQLALDACDFVDEKARKIGAVNTVLNRNGKLYGYNTDYDGLRYCLARANIFLQGKKVLVFGSGGTAHTVRAVAKDAGAREIVTISRTGENHYQNLFLHADAEILINTTPLGMFPHAGEVCAHVEDFPHCEGVLDAVYNPLLTKFVYDARQKGIPATCGLPMLVEQGRLAAEYFSGKAIAQSRTEEILRQLFAERRSIVLIGMPGAGKTTIGRQLAAALKLPFTDTDEVICQKTGQNIPQIFAQSGEAGFRDKETQVLREVCAIGGQVIACGGGAILREENRYLLKENSTVLYIDRPLAALATEGRPLSAGGQAAQLFTQREPLYRACCDVQITNTGSVEQAVQMALAAVRTAKSMI